MGLMMDKKYKYFTECYKYYTGKLYDWAESGSPEDADSYTKGMYHGFLMAKKGQDELRKLLIRDIVSKDSELMEKLAGGTDDNTGS